MEEAFVIVPITSLYIHNFVPTTPPEELFFEHHFELLDSSSDFTFSVLNQTSFVSQGMNISLEKGAIRIGQSSVDVTNLERPKKFPFSACILFKIVFKSPSNKMVIGDHLEAQIRNTVQLLRLYVRGDVFAPIAIIENFGTYPLPSFNRAEEHESNSSIPFSRITKYIKFFRHYNEHMCELKGLINGNKYLESWYKRINNAVYFFNESYFSRQSNILSLNHRRGNPIRLVNLVSALDALCGKDSSGKKLASNSALILGKIYPQISKEIEKLYKLRSDFVHASPDNLVNKISDQTIDSLRLYIQKIILINLELFNLKAFRESFVKSKMKNYFEYIEKTPNSREVKEAIEILFNFDDGYGWPHNTSYLLAKWT